MTSLIPLSLFCISPIKFGLTLALIVSQAPSQAALQVPDAAALGNSEPVIVSTDINKKPKTHREPKRGPVQPEIYPTKPQQQIRNLR